MSTSEREMLNDYKHDEEELVTRHAILVKRIASQYAHQLPVVVQYNDLLQAGLIGLLEAIRNYDWRKGASLETYARLRIRGSILDEIRRHNFMSRSDYEKCKELEQVVYEIEKDGQTVATPEKVSERIGIDVNEYHSLVSRSSGGRLFSLDSTTDSDELYASALADQDTDPVKQAIRNDERKELARFISSLPKNEQLVLSLYYLEDLNQAEIAKVLGLSESRVSQIRSQALLRYQARLSISATNKGKRVLESE